jgi:hypothetical protein
LEHELKSRLFEPFASKVREQGYGWEALPEGGKFRKYLQKEDKLGLGEMFDALRSLNGQGKDEYKRWLQSEHAGFPEKLRKVRTGRITEVRNRVHKIHEAVSRQDAEEVANPRWSPQNRP